MKILITIFLVFSSLLLRAQKVNPHTTDSLIRALAKCESEDTNKVKILNNIGRNLSDVNPNEGISYNERALQLSQKLNWPHGIAAACHLIGYNFAQKSDNVKALAYELQSLKLYEDMNDRDGIARVTGGISLIYDDLKDYTKAIAYDSIAISLARLEGNRHILGIQITNMGNIYADMEDTHRAMACYDTALKIAETEHDSTFIALNLGNIGTIYEIEKELSNALSYYFDALGINKAIGNTMGTELNLGNLGNLYESMAKDTIKTPGVTKSVYLSKATGFLSQAVTIAKEIKDLEGIFRYSQMLSETDALSGNYKQALADYQQYTKYKDSIFSKDNELKIANLGTRRETDLKEKQIQLNKLEKIQKRRERSAFIVGVGLLCIIIVVVMRNYDIQKKSNEVKEGLLRQKDLLMKEIHHRVKNNLQVISTLLDTELTNISDTHAKHAMTESTTRVRSISLIHQQLYQHENITTIEFSRFTKDLLHQVRSVFNKSGQAIALHNEMPETMLDIDTAVPLGLILNELMTNSYKYAFTNAAQGSIVISLQQKQDHYQLTYSDSGPGLPKDMDVSTLKSIGMQLIRNLSKQIGGRATYRDADKTFVITFKDEAGRQLTD